MSFTVHVSTTAVTLPGFAVGRIFSCVTLRIVTCSDLGATPIPTCTPGIKFAPNNVSLPLGIHFYDSGVFGHLSVIMIYLYKRYLACEKNGSIEIFHVYMWKGEVEVRADAHSTRPSQSMTPPQHSVSLLSPGPGLGCVSLGFGCCDSGAGRSCRRA